MFLKITQQHIVAIDNFFNKYQCENEKRNLEYIKIVGDEVNKYIFPDKYENKYGIWLIGYDGQVKGHSQIFLY